MQLHLYKTQSANNDMDKVALAFAIVNINLKRDTDIIRPKIPLAKDGVTNLKSFNYAYIPDLNRYYFINGIESFNNSIDVLFLEVDVLMTYRAEIIAGIKSYIADVNPLYKVDNITNATSNLNTVSKILSDVVLENTQSIIITTLEV